MFIARSTEKIIILFTFSYTWTLLLNMGIGIQVFWPFDFVTPYTNYSGPRQTQPSNTAIYIQRWYLFSEVYWTDKRSAADIWVVRIVIVNEGIDLTSSAMLLKQNKTYKVSYDLLLTNGYSSLEILFVYCYLFSIRRLLMN